MSRDPENNRINRCLPQWRNGRRAWFRTMYSKGCGGSNPLCGIEKPPVFRGLFSCVNPGNVRTDCCRRLPMESDFSASNGISARAFTLFALALIVGSCPACTRQRAGRDSPRPLNAVPAHRVTSRPVPSQSRSPLLAWWGPSWRGSAPPARRCGRPGTSRSSTRCRPQTSGRSPSS